eukprot:766360-Hanusia_phi.AAC.6
MAAGMEGKGGEGRGGRQEEREKRDRRETEDKEDKDERRERSEALKRFEMEMFDHRREGATIAIEQNLWKQVIYKRIDEYRKRSMRSKAAMADPTKCARAAQALAATNKSLVRFLDESIRFYFNILKTLLHICQVPLELSKFGAAGEVRAVDPLLYSEARKTEMRKSCHRTLVYLGDLQRYREMYKEGGEGDWQDVERFYRLASLLCHDSGNPHNQLAVIATYRDDDFAAFYNYARALLCSDPFESAKKNLTMVFEKNKKKYQELARKNALDRQIVDECTRLAHV